jgi:predicted nucleic acid-binding Zn finger protein
MYTINDMVGIKDLFDYFRNKYNPTSIVLYTDNTKYLEFYEALGFNKILKYVSNDTEHNTYVWTAKGKFGYIYLTTNILNNKQYVGQHRGYKLDKNYIGSGKIIKNLIKKYGKEIFKLQILDYADNQEELSNKELYYIEKLNTLFPNGYNLTTRKQASEPYIKNTISDETKEKLRLTSQRMWEDENWRQHFSNIQRELWKDPDYRKRQFISRKSAWQNEDYRSFQLSLLKKARENPDNKRKRIEACQSDDCKKLHSQLSTTMWKDEEYREKMLQIRKEQVTDEARLHMSQAQTKRFSNSEEREKVSNRLKDTFATTNLRDKISKTSKEHWQNEDYRNKISIARKKQWKNEEYRKSHAEAIEKFWADENKKEKWLKNHRKSMQSPEHRKKASENSLGRKWWNNGIISKFTKQKPEGDDWKEGRLYKSKTEK